MGIVPSHSKSQEVSPVVQEANTTKVPPLQAVETTKQQDNIFTNEINGVVENTKNSIDNNVNKPVPNFEVMSDLDSILSKTLVDLDADGKKVGDEVIDFVEPRSANSLPDKMQRFTFPTPNVEISKFTLRTNSMNQDNLIRPASHGRQVETENSWNFRKESLDGFDPSKFKIVNSQKKVANNIQKLNGDFSKQEEPSLLWRLGLASPADAYNNTAPRYVETRTQLPKPPSYDPTEEQLMAMIEKEYA